MKATFVACVPLTSTIVHLRNFSFRRTNLSTRALTEELHNASIAARVYGLPHVKHTFGGISMRWSLALDERLMTARGMEVHWRSSEAIRKYSREIAELGKVHLAGNLPFIRPALGEGVAEQLGNTPALYGTTR